MAHLKPGDPAPSFQLPSTQGPLSLDDYQGTWLILYFYPKDHTPGCTTQACDFRDALPGMNAKVIGISPDDIASHETFEQAHHLPFPLASDPEYHLAKTYGAYGEKKLYGKVYEGLLRSTFIINPEGKIAEAMYKVRAKNHANRVRERLGKLQA